MRIGVNLIPLRPGKIGGMETYARNLIKHIGLLDDKNEYFLYTAAHNNDSFDIEQKNFSKIIVDNEISHYSPRNYTQLQQKMLEKRYVRRIYKDWLRLGYRSAKLLNQSNLDLWFCPLISLDPRFIKLPTVITIPDVQQEYYPQFFSDDELANREINWRKSCFFATKVLTISEFSKRSLHEKYQVPPEKIEVTLLSVADEFMIKNKDQDKAVSKRYSLPDSYAFYPANTWPHKNHKLLIMGFALFKKKNNSSLKLVLSGVDDAKAELEQFINKYGLENEVIFLSYVDRSEMPSIYRNADFMIFPSLFEGFCIPLLEAMASDCPVAASNSTSIPEIAGNAAFFFDPRNPQEIAGAFKTMDSDPALRSNLIKAGYKQLNNFSWDNTANQTIKIFEELYQGIGGVSGS